MQATRKTPGYKWWKESATGVIETYRTMNEDIALSASKRTEALCKMLGMNEAVALFESGPDEIVRRMREDYEQDQRLHPLTAEAERADG